MGGNSTYIKAHSPELESLFTGCVGSGHASIFQSLFPFPKMAIRIPSK